MWQGAEGYDSQLGVDEFHIWISGLSNSTNHGLGFMVTLRSASTSAAAKSEHLSVLVFSVEC